MSVATVGGKTAKGLVIDFPEIVPSGAKSEHGTNEAFLNAILGSPKIHHLSRREVILPGSGRTRSGTAGIFYEAVNTAYDVHAPVALRPEVLWYMLMYEVARYVKMNAAECAHFFTDDPSKKKYLEVRDDSLVFGSPSNDWGRAIGLFYPKLNGQIDATVIGSFLPQLSTMGKEEQVATLIAFMETVSPYYDFGMRTMCGFPRIRVEGTAQDWTNMVRAARELSGMLEGLRPFFADLIPVFERIAETVGTGAVDPAFWSSMFKLGGGSGGPYITGWITALNAFVTNYDGNPELRQSFNWQKARAFGGLTSDQLPSHVSEVPFTWHYYGESLPMKLISGIIGVEEDDGFVSPRLGFGVIEAKKAA